LKDKRNIKFAGLFLLLLYLFGNSPALMFHHHDEIIAFEKQPNVKKLFTIQMAAIVSANIKPTLAKY
jgi:hypothetical protein